MSEIKQVPLLVLDLDGTVRHGRDELGRHVHRPEDVVVFDEAVEMMRRWRSGGGRIVGVTNQGGIALGHLTFLECRRTIRETQRRTGNLFDEIVFCPHHPDAKDPVQARCWCRKPAPGLLVGAAMTLGCRHREKYPPYMALMVGDRPEDQECARVASVDFQWAAEWRAGAALASGSEPR